MKRNLLKQLVFFVSKSSILVGGQAVIEGVMMRVPGAYSTAVRDPEGKIHTDRHFFESIIDRKPKLKKPVIRGAISLFEAMRMGFKTLQWSSEIAMPEEEKPGPIVDSLMTFLSIILAIGLFFAAPIGLTSWLFDKDQDAFVFNMISNMFENDVAPHPKIGLLAIFVIANCQISILIDEKKFSILKNKLNL